MDLVKTGKDIVKNVEQQVEKGLDVVKERFDNVARHLPFANLAKHSNDTFDIEIDLPGAYIGVFGHQCRSTFGHPSKNIF